MDRQEEDYHEEVTDELISREQEQQSTQANPARNPYIENDFDFKKYIQDPNIRGTYPGIDEIDKNHTLGYIQKNDEQLILLQSDILSDFDFLLKLKPDSRMAVSSRARTSVLRDIFTTLTLSRSRKGFAAKLLNMTITQNELVRKKDGGWFKRRQE